MEITNQKTCLNCNHSLELDAKFCAACGQKTTTGRITFGKILGDFFMNIFSLDSKLAHTLPSLFFRPGRLTKEYFKGRHQSYVKPISLLFFSSLILFAIIFSVEGIINIDIPINDDKHSLEIEQQHNALVSKIDTAKMICKEQISNPKIHSVIDSAFIQFVPKNKIEKDSMTFGTFTMIGEESTITIKVSKKDLAELTVDSLLNKYEVTHWSDRFLLGQMLKINKDGKEFIQYALSRLSWVYFLLIPLTALFLKLLYIRRKHYYVEHVVFGLHFYSFLALIMGLSIFFSYFSMTTVLWGLAIYSLLYLLIAMKNFYGQSKRKTFFKYCLLLMSYIFSILLAILIVSLVSLALF